MRREDDRRQVPFLQRLPGPDRAALLKLGTGHRLQVTQPVLRLGSPGTEVVLLEAGYVKVASTDPEAHYVILDIGGPGELYGEAAVISGRPRMADVVALSALSLRRIDADSFRLYLRTHPAAMYELLRQLADRLSAAQQQRTHTRTPDTITRVARRLVYLVDICATETATGWRLDAPLSQDELAAFIPLGRTAFATTLERLREMGVISTRRRALSVLDLERLHCLAHM
ncbi:Crp/Fnr family transcriptional regulator [Amycolatopsis jejuensis]|uniref:Crp/Fnr family transcriptional regulator n=1 Tax=Amycolatopsis jejuensis TaxID=330084 RepID=UPI0005266B24|nr:Crp/Fnr family transcriptional regulator [Amycolatopsis jejuensis]